MRTRKQHATTFTTSFSSRTTCSLCFKCCGGLSLQFKPKRNHNSNMLTHHILRQKNYLNNAHMPIDVTQQWNNWRNHTYISDIQSGTLKQIRACTQTRLHVGWKIMDGQIRCTWKRVMMLSVIMDLSDCARCKYGATPNGGKF